LEEVTDMGLAKTRLYTTWKNMKSRCYNKNIPAYTDYGGRGITVCEDWLSFSNFYEWAMANGYNDNLTLERIDVNKGYFPDNCKWIPKTEQPKNRRNIIRVEGKTLEEISDLSGIDRAEIKSRYFRGARTIQELSKPLKKPVLVDGKTLKEISLETGINYDTLKVRYRNGARDYKKLTRRLYVR
jgi:hypothetical protein